MFALVIPAKQRRESESNVLKIEFPLRARGYAYTRSSFRPSNVASRNLVL